MMMMQPMHADPQHTHVPLTPGKLMIQPPPCHPSTEVPTHLLPRVLPFHPLSFLSLRNQPLEPEKLGQGRNLYPHESHLPSSQTGRISPFPHSPTRFGCFRGACSALQSPRKPPPGLLPNHRTSMLAVNKASTDSGCSRTVLVLISVHLTDSLSGTAITTRHG